MISSIFPDKVQGALLTGAFLSAAASVLIAFVNWFILDFEQINNQVLELSYFNVFYIAGSCLGLYCTHKLMKSRITTYYLEEALLSQINNGQR